MTFRRCYGCMNTVEGDTCPHCGCEGTLQNQAHQLPVGTVLKEQFLVGRALGQGGFGITYIGLDIHLERVVAIKEFYPAAVVNRDVSQSSSVQLNTADSRKQYEDNRDRFLREARALAKLDAVEEVVSVRSMFQENNTAYIIMEYVQGTDLRHYVRDRGGKLAPEELFPLMEPVLRALHSVHKAGLVHRDVSPDNIMILPDGKAKLLDFGAVRDWTDADADMDLSHSTEAILKHGFAPMEQYRSRGNLGPWTDEYGICASFYYCLTGRVPPDAPARAMGEEDVDWSALPGLQNRQRRALEKGMSMRAKDRLGDLEALRKALYEESAPASKPETKTPQTATATVKRKKGRGALIAALLLLIALGAGAAWFLNREAPEPAMEAVPTETEAVETTLVTETNPVVTEMPETTATSSSIESEMNVTWTWNWMMRRPIEKLEDLGVSRDSIQRVVFLDSLSSAPTDAVDISVDENGSVRAWVDLSDGCCVYFAAEGGINGSVSCADLFSGCLNLTSVEFNHAFHTDDSVDMSDMFYGCVNLESVDLGSLNTSKATDMSQMFCLYSGRLNNASKKDIYNEKIHYLDLSSWDVSNVKNVSRMFSGCKGLTEINIDGWNLENIADMSGMFSTSGIQLFDGEMLNLNTTEMINMSGMFYQCTSLVSADLGNWNTSMVSNMARMFYDCSNLQTLDVSEWNTGNVTDMSSMFYNCINLQALDVSGWNTSSVQNMNKTFYNCADIQQLVVKNWNVFNVTDMGYLFCGTGISEVDVSEWDVSNVLNMEKMFFECMELEVLDLTNWETNSKLEYNDFCSAWTKVNGQQWMYYFWNR